MEKNTKTNKVPEQKLEQKFVEVRKFSPKAPVFIKTEVKKVDEKKESLKTGYSAVTATKVSAKIKNLFGGKLK